MTRQTAFMIVKALFSVSLSAATTAAFTMHLLPLTAAVPLYLLAGVALGWGLPLPRTLNEDF